MLTPKVHYQAGQEVEVVIGLEGSPSFAYEYGDENFVRYRNTSAGSDTIRMTPLTPSANYKIMRVRNECGVGRIGDPSSFQIELITGTEPVSGNEFITFGPNPVQTELHIKFENFEPRQIEILNVYGSTLSDFRSTGMEASLNMSTLSSGIYLLKIRKKRMVTTYRIIKY